MEPGSGQVHMTPPPTVQQWTRPPPASPGGIDRPGNPGPPDAEGRVNRPSHPVQALDARGHARIAVAEERDVICGRPEAYPPDRVHSPTLGRARKPAVLVAHGRLCRCAHRDSPP